MAFSQNGTRRSFIQHHDTDDKFRLASEFGAVALEAASSAGSDSNTAYLVIDPGGTFTFGAENSDAVLTTDGNMTFRIDADNDETSQKFAFQTNASTEVAFLDDSGNLQLDGDLTVSGNDIKDSGANTVLLPVGGMIRVDRAATQTNSAANVNMHYADQEPGVYGDSSLYHIRRFMYNETGDRVIMIGPMFGLQSSQNLTDDVNKALELSCDSAFTTNCFTSVTIYLTYNVIDIS